MCTHNIPFVVIRIAHQGGFNEDTQAIIFNLEKDHPKFSKIYSQGIFSKGLKNEFETAVVNESSVFEHLKVYCTRESAQSFLSSPLVSET